MGDLGALSVDQQKLLNQFKVERGFEKCGATKTRIENEHYLKMHPEVQCLIAGFLGQVLCQKPENIREFAAGLDQTVWFERNGFLRRHCEVGYLGYPVSLISKHFTNPDLPELVEEQLQARQAKIKQYSILEKLKSTD